MVFSRQFRIGHNIYRRIVTPIFPGRGPIYVGAKGDDVAPFTDVVFYCSDYRKLFFSLLHPAERYGDIPADEYKNIVEVYPLFPYRFPNGLYATLLAEQIAPALILEQENVRLNPPAYVLSCASLLSTPDCPAEFFNFLTFLCDYYAIAKVDVPVSGASDPLSCAT